MIGCKSETKVSMEIKLYLILPGTKSQFSILEKMEKLWGHLMEKPSFFRKVSKIDDMPDSACIFFYQGWWITSRLGIEMPKTFGCVGCSFKIFQSFPGQNKGVKKPIKRSKMFFFDNFLTLLSRCHVQLPPVKHTGRIPVTGKPGHILYSPLLLFPGDPICLSLPSLGSPGVSLP